MSAHGKKRKMSPPVRWMLLVASLALASCGGGQPRVDYSALGGFIGGLNGGANYCARPGLVMASVPSPAGPMQACGIAQPISLRALGNGAVDITPDTTMDCRVAGALDRWTLESVMPAAYRFYGQPVVAYRSYGGFACRTIGRRAGGSLSQHAFGNAIDIAAVQLASGRWIALVDDWPRGGQDRAFLDTIQDGACGIFSTVLGPRYNAAHRDHFHLDLANRNRPFCR